MQLPFSFKKVQTGLVCNIDLTPTSTLLCALPSSADCYDCIDRCILVGGKCNLCPVCKILLGPNPWEHHKLKYDFMLDSLVRKVRPAG